MNGCDFGQARRFLAFLNRISELASGPPNTVREGQGRMFFYRTLSWGVL